MIRSHLYNTPASQILLDALTHSTQVGVNDVKEHIGTLRSNHD